MTPNSLSPSVARAALPPQLAIAFLALLCLAFQSWAGQASLAWNASTSSGVAGYNLYYGTTAGTYSSSISVPNQTTYIVPNLTEGKVYYFAVTARDSTGKESARSNEISYTVPSGTTSGPVPSFTASPTSGNVPLAVTFSGTATGTVTGWKWDFGDSTTSTQQNPTHSYSTAGTYSVSLTATGSTGSNTATQSNLITVSSGTTTPPPTVSCPCTIWPNTAKPTIASDPDGSAVNLGVKFKASQNGYITGMRFYKSSSNTGRHVGTLWTSGGRMLAQVTFTNETASGWQQANFSTPVPITANTVYVASYYAPNGHYAGDNNYFANTAVTRGPLTALRSGTSGANGVYKYLGTTAFPMDTWKASNYWVDVVFKP